LFSAKFFNTTISDRGQTKYRLEHYLDLIEKRPRSVFNAKPVKDSVSVQLLEFDRKLSGPREMVKLLRLYTDYGEDKLLKTIETIKGSEITVEQIQAHLIPVNAPAKIPLKILPNTDTIKESSTSKP